MRNKLENWIFYFFLFAIPISVRHIFNYEAFNFIEWTSVYIYGTDILLLVLFGFWVKNRPKITIGPADKFLLGFIVVAALSINNALDARTATFQWLKLFEGVSLYFYVKDYAMRRFDIENSLTAVVLGGVFQALIAIPQFATQGSLGLKYLGESVLAPALSGIAAFLVDGVKVIRAYGTTPHANILAIYLFIGLGALYALTLYHKRSWRWQAFHALMLWAFLLTFSRTIIGLWTITFAIRGILVLWYPRFSSEFWDNPQTRARCLRIFYFALVTIAVFAVIYWPYVANRAVISSADEAVQLRILYNEKVAGDGVSWFGHGIGNFVPWLMEQGIHLPREHYQPVHNIYLLIYSEIGVLGFALFTVFLVILIYDFWRQTKLRKLYHISFALVIGSMLIVGLFDHFLWTIQSGRLMFWMSLGLLATAQQRLSKI